MYESYPSTSAEFENPNCKLDPPNDFSVSESNAGVSTTSTFVAISGYS